MLGLAACGGDDDATDGTLGVIEPGASASTVPGGGQPVATGPAGTTLDPMNTVSTGMSRIGVPAFRPM